MSTLDNHIAATTFKPMRLSCAWGGTARHKWLCDIVATNVGRFGWSQQRAWDHMVADRAGLIGQVAAIGRTWIRHDCPAQYDDMLYMEVTSLSAN